jgi:hypothetical protein
MPTCPSPFDHRLGTPNTPIAASKRSRHAVNPSRCGCRAAQARLGIPVADRAPLYSGAVEDFLVPVLFRMGRGEEGAVVVELRRELARLYGEFSEIVLTFMLTNYRHHSMEGLLRAAKAIKRHSMGVHGGPSRADEAMFNFYPWNFTLADGQSRTFLMSNAAIFVGFDSAWADRKPGAICSVVFDGDCLVEFREPELVGFEKALIYIKSIERSDLPTLVAVDQPTIVPNADGMRPVDKTVSSLISWIGIFRAFFVMHRACR